MVSLLEQYETETQQTPVSGDTDLNNQVIKCDLENSKLLLDFTK